jgi:hypothetical protein
VVGGMSTLLNGKNLNLIVNALTAAASKESRTKVQVSIISALGDLIERHCLNSEQRSTIMECFLEIAESDSADGPVIASSLSYLQAAGKISESNEILSNIVQFTTSPYAKVRAKSLWLLRDLSSFNANTTTTFLLNKTDMLESFSLIIAYGSNSDCLDVLHICKLLISTNGHKCFCEYSAILKAFIGLVTMEPCSNRAAYMVGVEIIMELMSKDENLKYFLPFTAILPWLVKVANCTSDEVMKARFVSTVVRFSSALLDQV